MQLWQCLIKKPLQATLLQNVGSCHPARRPSASPLAPQPNFFKPASIRTGPISSGFHVRPFQRGICVRASATPSGSPPSQTESTKPTDDRPVIVNLPKALWLQLTQPLRDFGFGKKNIWEGGVGLFVITGVCLLALLLSWIKGLQARAKASKYTAVVEFSQACGITVGTPVRIRGVDVGSVVGIRPSLEKIDVSVQIMDAGIVIPKNAEVLVNQSGLISETLIDITPRVPVPVPTVGPLDSACHQEGLIVCDRDHIKGEQGVSLDELVGICTKLAKQIDDQGVERAFVLMDKVSGAIEDALPLLDKVEKMAHDAAPLIKGANEGDLLKTLDELMKVAADLGQELRTFSTTVVTAENREHLRKSIGALTKTLDNIESISGDLSIFTNDNSTKQHLKQVLETLSRLYED